MLDFLAVEKLGRDTVPALAGLDMAQINLDTAKNHWQVKVGIDSGIIFDKEELVGKHWSVVAVDMQGSGAACLADAGGSGGVEDTGSDGGGCCGCGAVDVWNR
ncbi:hypothetical protein K432DRAFT_378450 [Lepidopterella palustris CBS 459.81]|uniref:Uncharacterized protein n=1 Tax=Lepidopterella palustris CBS 459.81 TaxID=1314670 RepID=A0A8E2EIN7_9PEZI|nr:hypothetical protein K432DRAFT_378450 [Lepidopterella palustris CBS 459.81]